MQVRLEAMGIEDDTVDLLFRDVQLLVKLSDEELDVVHGSIRAGQGTVMRSSHASLQEGVEDGIQVIKKGWISAVDFLALSHFEGSSGHQQGMVILVYVPDAIKQDLVDSVWEHGSSCCS